MISIENDQQHADALKRLEKILWEDKTHDAEVVEQLATAIERYEAKRWPLPWNEDE